MSSTTPPRPDERAPDMLAAEYVLGVLGRQEHAAAGIRASRDRAFAAEVEEWESRLTPLFEQVEPVFPRASVWPAISTRLTPAWGASPEEETPPFWSRLAVWRGLTAVAAMVAAGLLIVVATDRGGPTVVAPPAGPAPAAVTVSVARLEAPSGGVAFVAAYDQARGELVITPTGEAADSGHSPELWLMPDGAPPQSLGVFMGRSTLVVRAPAGMTPDSTLGVSLEPLGGSTTGAPTGPVIAQGALMHL